MNNLLFGLYYDWPPLSIVTVLDIAYPAERRYFTYFINTHAL